MQRSLSFCSWGLLAVAIGIGACLLPAMPVIDSDAPVKLGELQVWDIVKKPWVTRICPRPAQSAHFLCPVPGLAPLP